MKKFTSNLLKPFLFSFILFSLLFLGAFNAIGAGTWNDTYYKIVYQDADNGYVQLDVLYQKVGGDGSVIPVGTSLYLQYQSTAGTWIDCMEVYQYGTRTYSASGIGGTSAYTSWPPGGLENFNDWGAGNYHMYIQMSNPSGIYNRPVNFRWVQDGKAIGNLFLLTFYKPNAPTGLQASTNECNQVSLSWSQPGNIRAGSNTYYIYRNGSYIGSSTTISYIDNTPADGTSYNYKVRLYNGSQYGEFSTEAKGNSRPVPDAPSGVTASKDRCDGTVYIGWQWYSAAPNNFRVARSTNADGSNSIILSSTIPGNQNYYEDTPPNRNTSYYYMVMTKNECTDWGSYSLPKEGIAADIPEAPENISYSIANNIVTITWDDNSAVEENYILTRTIVATGAKTEYELDANVVQYNDTEAQLCTRYKYDIKTVNSCGSSASDETGELLLPPNLSNTFLPGALTASKGYYPDRVKLEWVVSSNQEQIESFKIYRKEYGTIDSTLIATVDNTVTTYDDNYASNSVLYVYSVKGEVLCDGTPIYSDVTSDLGFKVPTGVVSGKITYQNGSATEGVSVTAESTEIPDFSSIALNGTSSFIEIPGSSFSLQDSFSIQTYVRFSEDKAVGIFNKGNQYSLDYTPGTLSFSVGTNILPATYVPPIDTFIQITAVFDGVSSYLYVDGELLAHTNGVAAPANNGDDFVLGRKGAGNYLNGYIDEIRLWKTVLDTTEVKNNFRSYINGNEKGLFAYYRLNENINIDKIFDLSKTGDNYNGNHGTLFNASYISTVIPAIEQLWFRSTTNQNGNYLITGIPYLGGGSNYKIVPMFAPHKFDPTNKMLYIGDGAKVHNNIDFINISTVTVTVNVFYNNTTFPVNEVRVLVDNRIQFDSNNEIVQTDENGTVDIEVPIGDHYLKFEKQFHGFKTSYFPGIDSLGNIERFAFTEPRTVNVLDTTRLRLVGKIVGGPVEAEKDLLSNINPTKNNLGKAIIELKTERGFDIDLDDNLDPLDDTPTIVTAYTNDETGYFYFDLLPEKYIPSGNLAIKTIKSGSNSGHTFNSDEDLTVIDMTSQFFEQVEFDSIFENDKFSHLDTTAIYNLRRDWIYRSVPEFSVHNEDGGKIISETEFEYSDDNGSDIITLAKEQGDSIYYYFGKPIFFFAQEYFIGLKAFEKYVNADDGEEDLVAVTDGRIIISNDISLQDKDIELKLDKNGEAGYKFLADFPNIADPFTKNLNITFKAGSTIVKWPSSSKPYEAYILGGRPTGNNFVTTGPAMVDFILRDPPGSNSSASLEVGHVNSSTFSYGISNTTESNIGGKVNLGAKISTVQGTPFFSVVSDTEAGSAIGGSVEASMSLGGGYEVVHTTTTTEVISTSDDPDFNGRDGDVFVGHSTNIIYGLSKNMDIMRLNDVQDGKDTISIADTFAISIKDGLRLSPEFDTYFTYSQRIIEEEMIPHLIQLRNVIFDKPSYVNNCACNIADPKYASKNDDARIWGGSASDVLSDGPSYTYTPPIDTLIDSVRYFNNQIENWIAVLAQNEKQKTEALADKNHQNISFGAGSVYESKIGSEYEKSYNLTYEVSLAVEVSGQVDFDFNGVGFELTFGIKNTTKETIEASTGSTKSQTVGYTLSDQDGENYLTVDVLKCQSGNGPVFKTRGGQTSCPYEGEELTRYFEPGDHTLSFATMMIDGPQLSVDNPISPLIPETAPALFTVNLQNVSQAEKDNWYLIGVDVASNPDGAKIMMDGSTINDGMAVFVPYGKTVTKTLEVWKGRSDVNDYENLIIYLSSTCDNISQEVPISAFFASACSTVEFDFPGKGWVINVNDNDLMYVKASGYNLQHIGFEDFHFQYTPTGTSSWITTQIFTNDPNKAGEDNTTYIDGATTMEYYWDMSGLADRGYDIRLVTHCENGSVNYSEVLSGILDGQRPKVFGTPQPADGILNVDDDILVQFNESIEGGLLTQFNFDVKGTLNNYPIEHNAFIRYNGSDDHSYIPEGLSFNDKSFTVEFWMRPDVYANSVILSQGNDPEKSIEIGLRDTDKTYFKIGNVEHEALLQFSPVVPSTAWQHMAYVFDYENGDIFIYQNDIVILEIRGQNTAVNNAGKIYLAKSSVPGGDNFAGGFHELRIWSKIWSIGDIYANQYTPLSGNEIGLYGYWPMDEAYGDLAIDKAAFRHMEIFAPWVVEPSGKAWDFSDSNFLSFFTGYFAIIPEMDFTVEFWFKDNNPADTVCLFSCQKGDGNEGDGTLNKGLSIFATPDGKIWVASKGNIFEATSNDYFDNSWHHFSLVVRRRGNVVSYIDGVAQNEHQNTIIGGISGGEMYLGVRKWFNTSSGQDRYYEGKMDEFRLWNLAKTSTQISMDMNSKLHGNEIGLMVYLPFEGYKDDGFGKQTLYNSLQNYVPEINAIDAVPNLTETFSTDAPNIKDARPIEDIAFDWVAAEDKIVIVPKDFLMQQLEKNIIEITVEGIEDKFGNRMASPVTWTAYVHRNQVRWEDERRNFTKELYKTLTFVSTIKNTGGQQIGFTLENLPPWLTASPLSGSINPESTLEIKFTINPALNIGEYNEDIILHTENGFDEKLPLTVRVHKSPPNWKIDPANFEASMSIVGSVKIEGVLSTDIFDMVAAFKRGTDSIRGVTNVRYISDFDSYLVFLNVYGNVNGEELEFRIWDASAGQILDNVTPDNTVFKTNAVLGTTYLPVIFEAKNLFRQYIPLAKGWNWVSFNKKASNRKNLNSFLSALEPQQNDQIKSHGVGFNNFDMTNGWNIGGIDSINNERMYQMKISNADTIIYSGEQIIPEENPITLTTGWNHIGYIPDLAMDVNDALRLYVASNSEIIKSQYAFSMFDERVGWLGTLELMQPGFGYMLNVKKDAILTYPNGTVFKDAKVPYYSSAPLGWGSDLSKYEGNISVVAKLDVSDVPEVTVNSNMVLGSFINDECHGFSSPLQNAGIGYDPFFLNVSNSESGQKVGFMLYDGATGNTYSIVESIPFTLDAVFGSTKEPVILTLKTVLTSSGGFENQAFIRCYPNPFNKQVNVEFSGTNESVTIDVVNANGSLVKNIYKGYPVSGTNTAVWDGNNQSGASISAGMYYIRFISGDAVETVKISKTR